MVIYPVLTLTKQGGQFVKLFNLLKDRDFVLLRKKKAHASSDISIFYYKASVVL